MTKPTGSTNPLDVLPATGLTSPNAADVRAYHVDNREIERAAREKELDKIKADLASVVEQAKAISREVMALWSEHGDFLTALHGLVEEEFFLRSGSPSITNALQRSTREVYNLLMSLQTGEIAAVPRRVENLSLADIQAREHLYLRKVVGWSADGPSAVRRDLQYIIETLWPAYTGRKPNPLATRNAVAAVEGGLSHV
ncbi:MAG: hypothetical protein HY701_15050 [Gemmatimonadetes bacterium]|nr:hypothetical protein [Gemmatimonadota bacterium]